jgi:nucleotide-binding universal stress UspA family protein
MANINPRWSTPSTILFATEIPTDEKAFAFALAQAAELSASIIVFHANGRLDVTDTEASGPPLVDYATARAMKERLEPLARRAKALGIECNIVVRSGLACDQILSLLRERKIDRVVIGSRSPGPIGKLLVGSVAEAVLRTADVPVCIVGPNVNEGSFHNLDTRTILCDVSTEAVRRAVASFAAQVAAMHKADLILQQVICPQEGAEVLAGRTIGQAEAELLSLVPTEFKANVNVRTMVVLGDPTEELLYEGRKQRANLMVMGAQGASQFAAITCAGTVYKVLAYSHCPVITLSPVVLRASGLTEQKPLTSEVHYLAGVI